MWIAHTISHNRLHNTGAKFYDLGQFRFSSDQVAVNWTNATINKNRIQVNSIIFIFVSYH